MIAQSPSQSKSSQAPVPSSRRPIPLRGRKDLCVQQIAFRGTPWWVIKDPVGLKYHRLPAHQYCVLNLLDGERSLKEIRDELSKQFPARFMQLSEVQRMITSLHQQGLLWNERPGQTASLINQQRKLRSQKVRQAFKSLLSMRLPGWDLDSVLRVMDRWLGWIYHPAVLSLAGALIVASWFLILVQFDEFRSRLPEFQQFFSWQNLFWLWVTLGATKVLHEFGHGLTCRHFGSECHEMGVMILIFSPTLYCDVTDSWMLRDKWQRIWIAAAGMGIEIFLSSVAIITWWFTTPGLLNHLCLNVFFVTTATTVLFNANPLLR
jgi:putative peptide zinc metalloprotease protein